MGLWETLVWKVACLVRISRAFGSGNVRAGETVEPVADNTLHTETEPETTQTRTSHNHTRTTKGIAQILGLTKCGGARTSSEFFLN